MRLEYINEIGQAVRTAGGRLPATWLEGVLHRLKHQGPERVLTHLSWLTARYPSSLIQEKLTYLQKREAHMQYPTYQEAGWPIGSGSVESANKLVVEARRVWGWDALGAAERQSDAGAAQRGLQSALAPDVGNITRSATSAAQESVASNESAASGPCLVLPRRVGSPGGSAVSPPGCCCHFADG